MKICKELQDEVGNLILFVSNAYPNVYDNKEFRDTLTHFHDSICNYRWGHDDDKEFDRKHCSADELTYVIKLSYEWLRVLVVLDEMLGGRYYGKTELSKIVDKIDKFFALEGKSCN